MSMFFHPQSMLQYDHSCDNMHDQRSLLLRTIRGAMSLRRGPQKGINTMDSSIGSLMVVAASDRAALLEGFAGHAGSVFCDLEDTVSEQAKAGARDLVVEMLAAGEFTGAYMIRLNARATEHWKHDLEKIIPAKPAYVVIPKIVCAQDLVDAEADIAQAESAAGIPVGTTKLVILIETAAAVLRVDSICAASERLHALLFGAEDYIGELGVNATVGGAEVAYARGAIACAAKAYGLVSIDRAWLSVDDDEGFYADGMTGRIMGFDGRFVVNEKQAEVANNFYAPTEFEVEKSRALLATLEDSLSRGAAVGVSGGTFVDLASIRRAKTILARWEALNADAD
ncbi:CoA ester lyase [Rhodococcus opacus]|nr:CoA ester lyase [Rhodococcus opacus]